MVLAADEAARAAGLQVGMQAAKARILVPGLLIQDHDPGVDAAALERLALWGRCQIGQGYAVVASCWP